MELCEQQNYKNYPTCKQCSKSTYKNKLFFNESKINFHSGFWRRPLQLKTPVCIHDPVMLITSVGSEDEIVYDAIDLMCSNKSQCSKADIVFIK